MVNQYGVTPPVLPGATLKYKSRKRTWLRRKIMLIRVALGLLIGIILLSGVATFIHRMGIKESSSAVLDGPRFTQSLDIPSATLSAAATQESQPVSLRRMRRSIYGGDMSLSEMVWAILRSKRVVAVIVLLSVVFLVAVGGGLVAWWRYSKATEDPLLDFESSPMAMMMSESADNVFGEEAPAPERSDLLSNFLSNENIRALIGLAFYFLFAFTCIMVVYVRSSQRCTSSLSLDSKPSFGHRYDFSFEDDVKKFLRDGKTDDHTGSGGGSDGGDFKRTIIEEQFDFGMDSDVLRMTSHLHDRKDRKDDKRGVDHDDDFRVGSGDSSSEGLSRVSSSHFGHRDRLS